MAAELRTGSGGPVRGALDRLRALTPEGRDAFLYGASALFAGVTAVAMRIPLYREWGRLAVGPYVAATVLMLVVALMLRSRTRARADPPDDEVSNLIRDAIVTKDEKSTRRHCAGRR